MGLSDELHGYLYPVDVKAAILEEHSKAQAERIAAWVMQHPEQFRDLIYLVLHDEKNVAQRAAYPMGIIAEKQPQWLQPYLSALLKRALQAEVHVAVKRHVARLLLEVEVPEALHGPVMNACFDWLQDPKEAVAVRAFSMKVLLRLCGQYPEITNELRTLAETVLQQNPTPGMMSCATHTLQKLNP